MLKPIQDTTGSRSHILPPSEPEITSSQDLNRLLGRWSEYQKQLEIMQVLMSYSESTGGHVQFPRRFHYLPVLIGADNRPILLFRFMQVVDEQIDYSKIKEEFANLSYAQIDGAISFLRKLAQINAFGIDVDDVEDEVESEDPELLDELKRGLADQETARVLHNDQRNR